MHFNVFVNTAQNRAPVSFKKTIELSHIPRYISIPGQNGESMVVEVTHDMLEAGTSDGFIVVRPADRQNKKAFEFFDRAGWYKMSGHASIYDVCKPKPQEEKLAA